MARGNGGEDVFVTDDDRKSFLFRLGQVCASHGWMVHAWVLMGNHFHLLLETLQANLVTGIKQLLGTFSQGWNRVRQRHGHVFQGRYKSIPVNGTEADVDGVSKWGQCSRIHKVLPIVDPFTLTPLTQIQKSRFNLIPVFQLKIYQATQQKI